MCSFVQGDIVIFSNFLVAPREISLSQRYGRGMRVLCLGTESDISQCYLPAIPIAYDLYIEKVKCAYGKCPSCQPCTQLSSNSLLTYLFLLIIVLCNMLFIRWLESHPKPDHIVGVINSMYVFTGSVVHAYERTDMEKHNNLLFMVLCVLYVFVIYYLKVFLSVAVKLSWCGILIQ